MRKSAPLLSLLLVMIPARHEQGLHSSRARQQSDWHPTLPVEGMPSEITTHAKLHPDWLEIRVTS